MNKNNKSLFKQAYDKLRDIKLKKLTFKQAYDKLRDIKLNLKKKDYIEIATTGNITAYYSDERFKTKIANISEPLKIINNLNGFYYVPNELAKKNGIIHTNKEIGLSAQDVQKVLPELINIAPFDLTRDKDGNKVSKSGENYLTISYERLAPVFVEAIKELQHKIKSQDEHIKELETKISKIDKTINKLLTFS